MMCEAFDKYDLADWIRKKLGLEHTKDSNYYSAIDKFFKDSELNVELPYEEDSCYVGLDLSEMGEDETKCGFRTRVADLLSEKMGDYFGDEGPRPEFADASWYDG
jgi:phage terminase large subunit-like protein